MLASITPLGERGRRSTWAVTVTAFLFGATWAGAGAGAALGTAGGAVLGAGAGAGDGVGASARLTVLAVALLVGITLELLPHRIPGPRRQVDERWLRQYRGWVYGLGFGAQLGLGVTTVVTSTATYVAILAALLVGGGGEGALVLGIYGALRGATPLAAAGVRRPDQLMALHAGLERRRGAVRRAAIALLSLALVLAVGGAA
jgi:hypothetical protein